MGILSQRELAYYGLSPARHICEANRFSLAVRSVRDQLFFRFRRPEGSIDALDRQRRDSNRGCKPSIYRPYDAASSDNHVLCGFSVRPVRPDRSNPDAVDESCDHRVITCAGCVFFVFGPVVKLQ